MIEIFDFNTPNGKGGGMDKQDLKKLLAGLSIAGLLSMGGVSGCSSTGSG